MKYSLFHYSNFYNMNVYLHCRYMHLQTNCNYTKSTKKKKKKIHIKIHFIIQVRVLQSICVVYLELVSKFMDYKL